MKTYKIYCNDETKRSLVITHAIDLGYLFIKLENNNNNLIIGKEA